MHNSLAGLGTEGLLKVLAVVLGEVVAGNGLATVLVYPLEDLVTRSVAETGEERDELAAKGSGGLVLEDDLVELSIVDDLEREGQRLVRI